MPYQILNDYALVLGSNSPRRKQFLTDLGLTFVVRASDIEENYPPELQGAAITDFIAKLKADAIALTHDKEILITSDTTVWSEGQSLGKPVDRPEAIAMLQRLSGKMHEVITSICLKTTQKEHVFHVVTAVHFKALSLEQIEYYIDQYQPYDKAGAYGIQEWIGLVGIERINGSYTNIVGLPTTELMEELIQFIKA
ncbi:Maf family nucleotide pyrophosphatase [Myroides odoratus]|uniref:dTTP/UTP pyrophosphatase n=1 Tax=Myroides odoratus TaxID=256 RepID=A0A9Q7E9N1_MYROD|nr:Maf family nucleotide pyrophosphatase [Myroides odoratus]EHQ44073.1 Septum formation protein Maf [Myroides odoratus DSM 2801]EKB05279.1 septum formation protein Maf [Myroides odoratus CIP 103059]QQU01367.1 septum formation protein Maf [Myroides odoratus]WQD56368.1 Maf family nucleotide pyrophosphatase [Myroides odoratus]STZ31358.1 Septum formation protein Maf [Myroides odoratus]